MTAFDAILRPTPKGIYCPPGDFYIDPVAAVDRAVITHGHADHARAGHGAVLATPETLAIMAARYGEAFSERRQAAVYGEVTAINGVDISLIPAGHVLGSAQAVVETGGKRLIASGDYKRRSDPTCAPFEPMDCDVFISEATFALPVFRHPDDRGEIAKLLASVRQFPERTHLVGAYALGKAQRIIALLREAGYDAPIYIHGAMTKLCALYEEFGVNLGPLEPATINDKEKKAKRDFAGKIVICPPSAFADKWSQRFAEPLAAFASGWMQIKMRSKQRGVELPLILSDHADWDELTRTIAEIQPQELWVTHGRDDALLRWAELAGMKARPLSLVGYEDENE
ncbi:MAG: ligase-associated DNA damage response exonuclease [Pseudomonadota bacterium]